MQGLFSWPEAKELAYECMITHVLDFFVNPFIGKIDFILSADLGMHVAEDAFGLDEEALGSVLLSFSVAWPATAFFSLSVTGSVWRASLGIEPEPVATPMVAGISA